MKEKVKYLGNPETKITKKTRTDVLLMEVSMMLEK
jgi:hypothetical protein